MKKNYKKAMITTELMLTIAMATVALILVLGLFHTNLREMFTNGNFQNMFKGNEENTFFSSFNRDYATSQMYVQTMGEQGLERIRQRANNSALDLSEEVVTNGSGSITTANTIAYLVKIINVIVGDPTICTKMSKPSTAKCEAIEDVERKYKVSLNSATLILQDLESGQRASISLGNGPGSGLNPSTNDATGQMPTEQIYDAIKAFSDSYKSYINSSYAFVQAPVTVQTPTGGAYRPTGKDDIKTVKKLLNNLLRNLDNSLVKANLGCSQEGLNAPIINEKCCNRELSDFNSGCWVGKNEKNAFLTWSDEVSQKIDAYQGTNPTELINILLNDEYFQTDRLKTIKNDHFNDIPSCDVLKNGLNTILNRYMTEGVAMPDCIPNNQYTN